MLFNVISKLFSRCIATLLFGSCGGNCRIGPQAHLRGYANIHIGRNFFCGQLLYLNTNAISEIHIGNDVMLGPRVMIISGNHVMDYPDGPMNRAPPKKKGDDAGIFIEDDVWIGAGAIILDGAHISQGSIVGAGAVLTRYIPPYCIAAGNPCKTIRSRFSRDDLLNLLTKTRTKLTIEQIDSIYSKHSVEYKSNAHPPIEQGTQGKSIIIGI